MTQLDTSYPHTPHRTDARPSSLSLRAGQAVLLLLLRQPTQDDGTSHPHTLPPTPPTPTLTTPLPHLAPSYCARCSRRRTMPRPTRPTTTASTCGRSCTTPGGRGNSPPSTDWWTGREPRKRGRAPERKRVGESGSGMEEKLARCRFWFILRITAPAHADTHLVDYVLLVHLCAFAAPFPPPPKPPPPLLSFPRPPLLIFCLAAARRRTLGCSTA